MILGSAVWSPGFSRRDSRIATELGKLLRKCRLAFRGAQAGTPYLGHCSTVLFEGCISRRISSRLGARCLFLNKSMQPLVQSLAGETLELPLAYIQARKSVARKSLAQDLAPFREFGQTTRKLATVFVDADGKSREVPTYVNEFWTAKQRQAHSLHEISYRACFKPQ